MRDHTHNTMISVIDVNTHEATTSTKGVLPRYLRYWVNSIPLQSCILFNNRYKRDYNMIYIYLIL